MSYGYTYGGNDSYEIFEGDGTVEPWKVVKMLNEYEALKAILGKYPQGQTILTRVKWAT